MTIRLSKVNKIRKDMIKREIVSKVAKQTNMLRSEVEAVIDATLDAISESLINGERVILRNFGTFKVEKGKSQKGYDFGKGVSMTVPEKYRPKLHFSKDLIHEINVANMSRELGI